MTSDHYLSYIYLIRKVMQTLSTVLLQNITEMNANGHEMNMTSLFVVEIKTVQANNVAERVTSI